MTFQSQLKKMEQEEKRRREKEGESLTPEELRELKKLQEEADLKTALDTLGLDTSALASIDSFNATTKEEFTELSDVLVKRLHSLRAKEEYVNFLDEFVRNLLAPCKFTETVSGHLKNFILTLITFQCLQSTSVKSKRR